jgi:hypothetical protein
MSKIVELAVGNSAILVEAEEAKIESGIIQAGGLSIEKNLDKMLSLLKPFCNSIMNTFQDLCNKPDTATAEFGLSVVGEGNLFIVKASGEATIKITLTWSIK